MISDDALETRLRMWGQVERQANSIGLGYGSHPLAMVIEYGTRVGGSAKSPDDVLVDQTDQIVRRLFKYKPKAHKAVKIRYTTIDENGDGITDDDCARRFGASRSCFQRWLKVGRDYVALNL